METPQVRNLSNRVSLALYPGSVLSIFAFSCKPWRLPHPTPVHQHQELVPVSKLNLSKHPVRSQEDLEAIALALSQALSIENFTNIKPPLLTALGELRMQSNAAPVGTLEDAKQLAWGFKRALKALGLTFSHRQLLDAVSVLCGAHHYDELRTQLQGADFGQSESPPNRAEFAFNLPDAIAKLTPAQRADRVVTTSELCAFEDDNGVSHVFVRGVLPLKVKGSSETFHIGAWAEMDWAAGTAVIEQMRSGNHYELSTFVGLLANSVPLHALPSEGLAVTVESTGPKTRPHLILRDGIHSLTQEQKEGISTDRVSAYLAAISAPTAQIPPGHTEGTDTRKRFVEFLEEALSLKTYREGSEAEEPVQMRIYPGQQDLDTMIMVRFPEEDGLQNFVYRTHGEGSGLLLDEDVPRMNLRPEIFGKEASKRLVALIQVVTANLGRVEEGFARGYQGWPKVAFAGEESGGPRKRTATAQSLETPVKSKSAPSKLKGVRKTILDFLQLSLAEQAVRQRATDPREGFQITVWPLAEGLDTFFMFSVPDTDEGSVYLFRELGQGEGHLAEKDILPLWDAGANNGPEFFAETALRRIAFVAKAIESGVGRVEEAVLAKGPASERAVKKRKW
jgi:hypothetical protein